MTIERLTETNIDSYLVYLREAVKLEPDLMFTDVIDEKAIKERIIDPFYNKTANLVAIEDGKTVGRIEYHFYGCLQDGYRMCYIDWVYVLPDYRHKGIAQSLFLAMEKDCKEHNIDQYFLIRAKNPYADKFYKSFENVELIDYPILNKNLK